MRKRQEEQQLRGEGVSDTWTLRRGKLVELDERTGKNNKDSGERKINGEKVYENWRTDSSVDRVWLFGRTLKDAEKKEVRISFILYQKVLITLM